MRNITTENYVIEFDSGYKSLTNIINERNYTKIRMDLRDTSYDIFMKI